MIWERLNLLGFDDDCDSLLLFFIRLSLGLVALGSSGHKPFLVFLALV